MPSLKALKNRIASVKSTKKITKAKQMVAAVSVALVVQGVGVASELKTNANDESEGYYARAASLFRSTTLAAETEFYTGLGAVFEGARLTILRDFRTQTQVQIFRVRDESFEEVFLEARFATGGFGAPSKEMGDGSTRSRADVDSYLIEISADEFNATMKALRHLAETPAESTDLTPRPCLHPAGAYFESIERAERTFFSRNACEADFGDAVLSAAPLFEFAVKKLHSAAEDFDFASGLFEEIAQKAKSEN